MRDANEMAKQRLLSSSFLAELLTDRLSKSLLESKCDPDLVVEVEKDLDFVKDINPAVLTNEHRRVIADAEAAVAARRSGGTKRT